MFKRIMSVMLAIVMLLSVAMIATSAAQVEIADNSADAVAEVAADGAADTGADAGADTGAGNVINFKVEGSGWKNFKKVFCHIWEHNGDDFFAWQAKAEACKDEDGDGIWTYDLDAKGVTLEPGKLYAVIFSNENNMQTYDLLMDSTCIGDTVYCDLNQSFENPEDSSKTALAAFWTSKDPVAFGPVKCVTSIGNVVGTCIPATTSAQAMFVDFLVNKLENARTYSGKNDQQLLDDTDIKVYYTRISDKSVYLRPRVTLANDVNADLFVSVQVWAPMKERIGANFFRASKKLYSIYDTNMIFEEQ